MIGCQKKEQPVIGLDANLAKAWEFKPGTYWIYKDSLTGEVDSCAVTKAEFSNTSSSSYAPVTQNYQQDDITISVFVNNIFKTFWNYNLEGVEIWFGPIDPTSHLKNYEYIFYDLIISYPIKKVTYYYDSTKYSLADTLINNYSVGNTIYNNVYLDHFYYYKNGDYYSCNDRLYFCENIGMIKMNISHPVDSIYHVWELTNYKIIK